MIIDRFEGEYNFLSNFYKSPITIEGITYPTVEHFYQAQKTHDTQIKQTIANLRFPGQAKKYGRKIPLREDWDEIKLDIMLWGLTEKFNEPELESLLLKTGNATLIEGNNWGDTYWGQCNGNGLNMLGKLLMEVRDQIKNGKNI